MIYTREYFVCTCYSFQILCKRYGLSFIVHVYFVSWQNPIIFDSAIAMVIWVQNNAVIWVRYMNILSVYKIAYLGMKSLFGYEISLVFLLKMVFHSF